jgi:hypothetical protein
LIKQADLAQRPRFAAIVMTAPTKVSPEPLLGICSGLVAWSLVGIGGVLVLAGIRARRLRL